MDKLPHSTEKSSTPVLTPRQLEIIQHSLGVDQYGRGRMYRNHFCAGDDDEPTCRELVALGLMKPFTRSWLPYYNCIVTESGIAAMLFNSPAPPKLTRSQERYRDFLNSNTGESFIEWLKRKTLQRAETSVRHETKEHP